MVKLIAPLDCVQEVLAEGTAVSEKFEFVLDTTNDVAALQHNIQSQQKQLAKFLNFNSGENAAQLVNNYLMLLCL